MEARIGVDDRRDLAHLEGEGGVFKGLLHHAAGEETEISSILEGPAIGTLLSEMSEILRPDSRLQSGDLFHHLAFGRRDGLPRSTAHGISAVAVLAQKMQTPNLEAGSIWCR